MMHVQSCIKCLVLAQCVSAFFEVDQESKYDALFLVQRRAKREQRSPQITMAICLTGAARTIVDSDVQGFSSHVRNSKYARGLRSAEPDLFMYVGLGDTSGSRYLAETNESALQSAIEALSPTFLKVDNSSGEYQIPDGLPKYFPNEALQKLGVDPSVGTDCLVRGFKKDPENVARAMNFFGSWHTCHEMMQQQERSVGKQYDLVMFTRPDLSWKQDIPTSWLSPDASDFGIDWWMILPRELADNVANALQDFLFTKNEESFKPCLKSSERTILCREQNSCAKHDKTCYPVARYEALTKRLDGTEDMSNSSRDNTNFKEPLQLEIDDSLYNLKTSTMNTLIGLSPS